MARRAMHLVVRKQGRSSRPAGGLRVFAGRHRPALEAWCAHDSRLPADFQAEQAPWRPHRMLTCRQPTAGRRRGRCAHVRRSAACVQALTAPLRNQGSGRHLEQAVVQVQPDHAALRVDHADLPVVHRPAHVVPDVAVGARDQLTCARARAPRRCLTAPACRLHGRRAPPARRRPSAPASLARVWRRKQSAAARSRPACEALCWRGAACDRAGRARRRGGVNLARCQGASQVSPNADQGQWQGTHACACLLLKP